MQFYDTIEAVYTFMKNKDEKHPYKNPYFRGYCDCAEFFLGKMEFDKESIMANDSRTIEKWTHTLTGWIDAFDWFRIHLAVHAPNYLKLDKAYLRGWLECLQWMHK